MRKICIIIIFSVIHTVLLGQSQSEKDLYYTCKIWGFLKYYHPAIMAGKHDCDTMLFNILDKLHYIQTKETRNELFSELIDKLGDFNTEKRMVIDYSSLFRQIPDHGWLENRDELSNRLSNQLIAIKNAERKNKSYYVGNKNQYVGLYFRNEKPYNVDFTDNRYALLGLFRFWNAIEYFSPYKYLNDKNWDHVLKEFIPQFSKIKSKDNYFDAITRLSACVNDSHVGITPTDASQSYYTFLITNGIYYSNTIPRHTILIDSMVVVTEYNRAKWEKWGSREKCNLKSGDILLKVDGELLEKKINHLNSYVATSVRNGAKITDNIISFNRDSITIELIRNDSVMTIVEQLHPMWHNSKNEVKNNNPFKNFQQTPYMMLKDSIMYTDMSKLDKNMVKHLFLDESKGMVIDLRNYPKDPWVIRKLSRYLKTDMTKFIIFYNPDVQHPGYFKKSSEYYKKIPTYKNYYNEPIVVLVGENTISNGEFSTMLLQTVSNVITIGQQTAGTDGDIVRIILPGEIIIRFSGLGVYYPDGGETQRVGVRIDEIVKPTIKGIREGRDEVLERAIEIINNQK